MPDIADVAWSERDDRNSEAVPDGWPQGTMPAYVDQSGRMMMAATKRFWNKINPAYQTSGSGDAYVVQAEASSQINLYEIIRVRIDRSNTTTTPTLQFGTTSARTIVKTGPSGYVALAVGDMQAGADHAFWYNGAFYILSNPSLANLASWATVTRADGFDTFTGSPSSANFRALLTDELGTGSAVFESVVPLVSPAGRVTLTTGVPVTTSDVSGATSIYYTPAAGDRCPIYNGTRWTSTVFTELTLALDATSAHTGYQQSGKIFDLFVISDAGTIRLVSGPAWSSDTARGTGAGTTELQLLNGLWTNKNALATARFGSASGNTVAVAANQGTYVGSFRATADGQASDTLLLRLVWNTYNQAQRVFRRGDPASNWNYSLAAFRQVNANTANKIGILAGLAGGTVTAAMLSIANSSGATVRNVYSGIGIDSTTVNSAQIFETGQATTTVFANPQATYNGQPGLGYHELIMLEQGAGTDTQGWLGVSFATGILGTCYS